MSCVQTWNNVYHWNLHFQNVFLYQNMIAENRMCTLFSCSPPVEEYSGTLAIKSIKTWCDSTWKLEFIKTFYIKWTAKKEKMFQVDLAVQRNLTSKKQCTLILPDTRGIACIELYEQTRTCHIKTLIWQLTSRWSIIQFLGAHWGHHMITRSINLYWH